MAAASIAAALAAGPCWPAAASEGAPELDTVREMLRLDAERALAQERGPAARPAPAHGAPRIDRIRVQALYGMAGRRTAVLDINGERKEYREGAETPLGGASAADYRLARIDDRCLHLVKAGRNRVACFIPPPGQGPGASPAPPPRVAPMMPMPPLSMPQMSMPPMSMPQTSSPPQSLLPPVSPPQAGAMPWPPQPDPSR
ncbi:hypothetical protein GCM10023144_03460 [Pigmentiphaga soli]|uniref:Type II secretion system protein GspC N-terminal domain-containing protein n=2 Tax=Pigmentiphaga soli TaxID=1007095 RepID=A0ABP8GF55_9BURK